MVTFLSALKSELLDPKNRNKEESNLPPNEIKALDQLIQLIKERKLVIKTNDKGAGIMLMDFDKYVEACYEHLDSKQEYNGEAIPYYSKVDDFEIVRTKQAIRKVVDEGVEKDFITKEEKTAMLSEDKEAAKFYCNFKVHKEHEPGSAPPVRPIISGTGSVMENVGKFVAKHTNSAANKHSSYIQDTPDFLRNLELFKTGKLKKNTILATLDVKALFTNIQHGEGLSSLEKQLNKYSNSKIPSSYISKLMNLLLKHNIFSFNNENFVQNIGGPMGSPPVPDYANMFMADRIDSEIEKLALKYNRGDENALQLLKRFLDDIFLIFVGSTKELHNLYKDINNINPTMQFTINHTTLENESPEQKCDCEPKTKIPFLDTLCYIKNGSIETDLFKKETDRNQYLLPSSCHSRQTTKNLPFSLSTRIIRICSEPENRDLRLNQMRQDLLERNYKTSIIDLAINKAKSKNRAETLKEKVKPRQSERPVFATPYDPRIPSIQNNIAKHWRSMVSQDQNLAKVFEEPPLTGFKRQPTIRNHLIRAKLPNPQKPYPQRSEKGMFKCGRECPTCPFVKEQKNIKINRQSDWKINRKVNCNSFNVVYIIECTKNNCKQKYIGETKRMLKYRFADHRGYVSNCDTNTATGAHFNSPGHSQANMKISIIEQIKKKDDLYRKQREKYYIEKFNTQNDGLNRKK